MSIALGLIAMAGFIVGIVGLAAGVTWTVVRLSPAEKPSAPKPPAAS